MILYIVEYFDGIDWQRYRVYKTEEEQKSACESLAAAGFGVRMIEQLPAS